MRAAPPFTLERFRVLDSAYGTTSAHKNLGAFRVPTGATRTYLLCIADDGSFTGWEHVAVTIAHENVERGRELTGRAPMQWEMERVRRAFFADDETPYELWLPPKLYPNHHAHMRHIWRRLSHAGTKLPPAELVCSGAAALRKRVRMAT